MPYDYHAVFSLCGIAIAFFRYTLYFRGILGGSIKPHVFTWFLWGILTGIIFLAQFVSGAGPAAWIAGFVAIACLAISALAYFKKGPTDIVMADWVWLVAALAAVALWFFTKNPLTAVLVIMVADGISYIPTYRKSFYKPYEESAGGFALAALRSVFALAAIDSFLLVNWIHTAFLIVADGGCALFIWTRRKQLRL